MPVQQYWVGKLSGLLFVRHLQNDGFANVLHDILAKIIGRKYNHAHSIAKAKMTKPT
jgi:hypothetical protein